MPQTKKYSKPPRTRRVRKFAQGLKPVEKKEVKVIATALDNKGKQVCEKLLRTPGVPDVGSAYANYPFPGIPASGDDLMDLMPDINQAGQTGQQASSRERRLGSKIKLSSLKTNYMFHIPPGTEANPDYSSVACRLLVLSSKTIKKFSLLKQEWATGTQSLGRRYLKDGDTETWFQGDLGSICFPVNHALFTTHHDKRFILNRGLPQPAAVGAGTGRVVPDAIRTLSYNFRVKSKYIRFPEPTSGENEDFAPFAILLYAPINGGVSSTAYTCVNGKCFVHCTWKNLM